MCVKYRLNGELSAGRKGFLRYMFRIPLLPMKNQNASFFICNMEKEVFILKQLYLTVKDSVKESRRVQALVGVSLFTAMNIILSGYSIRLIPEVLTISFGSLATAASGFFFGPFLNGLAGIISDNLSYMVAPNGPWFPGWMINSMFIGFFYGVMFYRQPRISLRRCIVARLGVVLVVNLLLNPLWMSMTMGNTFIYYLSVRIVKNIVAFPFEVAALYYVMQICVRIRNSRGMHKPLNTEK